MTLNEARARYAALPTTSEPAEYLAGHGNWGLTEEEATEATELARFITSAAYRKARRENEGS